MSSKNKKTKFNHNTSVLIQSVFVLLGTPVFFLIDSPWLTPHFLYGQDITNAIMVLVYSWFLLNAKGRVYWIMLLMTFCGLCAECISSLILTLYQYRFKNIPLYIPLGHALIYATVYYICKQSWVWRNHRVIEKCLGKFAFVSAFMSLFILNDVAGFICYIVFLIILHDRKKPLFYLSMFVMVYYIELFGTVFSTWSWYGVIGNHPHFPPIGYTPSSMAGLYLLVDLVSCSVYFYAQKIRRYLWTMGLSLKSKTLNTSAAF
ncbi:hypothetical protein [Legionella maioricensis]|uniref:Uncharacterized protein n=1 Tax=Legionella maioricensis TaxID=2896528 RepID=A0A9X2IC72_9GAMM|nr:hypothetical protein [Legionella maioricensis]MCL9683453.1 hypothetical protein [Legionella maioricensis]MCL9688624.1 hypothetical protein [Legionella maioricensis]